MFTTFTMFRSRDREDRTTLDELFIGYRLKSLLSGRARATEACGTLHLSFPTPAGSNQTPQQDGIPRI